MENEVQLLREAWVIAMQKGHLRTKDNIVYELFFLLEKMVAMLREHENQLNHVHRVPGGEDEDDEK